MSDEKPKSRIKPPPLLALEDAPTDGKFIVVSDGVNHVEAFYRSTRYFDKNGGKWRVRGYWAKCNSGGAPVDFEPIGWRPTTGMGA